MSRIDDAGRRFIVFTVLSAGVVLTAAAGAGAQADQTERNFGRTDSIALDQPRVDVEFRDPSTGDVVGPGFIGRSFILDTGANGSLIGQFGHFKPLEDSGGFPVIDRDLYEVEGQYAELGVGGYSFFNLLDDYTQAHRGIQFNADKGEFEPGPFHEIDNLHALADPDLSLGSFGGIAGMPAMENRRVRINPRTMTPLGYMNVSFPESGASTDEPPEGSTTHRINLDRLEVSHSDPNADPKPTFAPLPLMNQVTATTSQEQAGGDTPNPATETFLLDTGAQMSMLTGETARDMGIDPYQDAQDFLPVSGVSGTTEIPLVQLEQLRIPTADGSAADELVFEDLVVGVLDLTDPGGQPYANDDLGFGGILGSNALTSGYLEHLFTDNDGFFDRIDLDFTGEQWFMELVENPDFERATEDQQFANLSESGETLLSESFEDEFETSVSFRNAFGDSAWVMLATDPVNHLGSVSASVPEPGTLALLSAGAAGLLGVRRRRRAE